MDDTCLKNYGSKITTNSTVAMGIKGIIIIIIIIIIDGFMFAVQNETNPTLTI
jgi:hypothetical protein